MRNQSAASGRWLWEKAPMKWRINVGRYLGIDVYLHVTFLIVVGVIALSYWLRVREAWAVLEGVGLFLSVFLCVLLHEFGHALAARRYGIRTEDITLLPIGGLARLERLPDKPAQELIVAIAGPAVNVVIAAVLFVLIQLFGSIPRLEELDVAAGPFLGRLLMINVGLVVFNMIPAFPMDGGRVLRAVLAMMMPHAKATRIAAVIGQGMAVVFAVAAFFGNPLLLLIALFVWVGAQSEAGAAEAKSLLSGVRVRAGMLTDFHTLHPDDPLSKAAELIMKGCQHDFPIVQDGRFLGVLTRDRLVQGLSRHGLQAPVAPEMETEFVTAEADELIENVLPRLRTSGTLSVAPVYTEGRLVGLLSLENVGEYMMIRSALEHGRVTAAAPVV